MEPVSKGYHCPAVFQTVWNKISGQPESGLKIEAAAVSSHVLGQKIAALLSCLYIYWSIIKTGCFTVVLASLGAFASPVFGVDGEPGRPPTMDLE